MDEKINSLSGHELELSCKEVVSLILESNIKANARMRADAIGLQIYGYTSALNADDYDLAYTHATMAMSEFIKACEDFLVFNRALSKMNPGDIDFRKAADNLTSSHSSEVRRFAHNRIKNSSSDEDLYMNMLGILPFDNYSSLGGKMNKQMYEKAALSSAAAHLGLVLNVCNQLVDKGSEKPKWSVLKETYDNEKHGLRVLRTTPGLVKKYPGLHKVSWAIFDADEKKSRDSYILKTLSLENLPIHFMSTMKDMTKLMSSVVLHQSAQWHYLIEGQPNGVEFVDAQKYILSLSTSPAFDSKKRVH